MLKHFNIANNYIRYPGNLTKSTDTNDNIVTFKLSLFRGYETPVEEEKT